MYAHAQVWAHRRVADNHDDNRHTHRLFCSVMKPFESITITGAQRFTSYSGYGRSFRCAGFYQDETPLDEHQRRRCLIIAMDAVVAFGGKQWDDDKIERDIVKALCAFSRSPIGPESTPPTSPTSDLWSTLPEDNGRIATGNWGCGGMVMRCSLAVAREMERHTCARVKQELTRFDYLAEQHSAATRGSSSCSSGLRQASHDARDCSTLRSVSHTRAPIWRI